MKTLQEIPDVLTKRIHTEEAISLVKTTFEKELSQSLNLRKISAPIVVLKGTGINDDLNGVERPVKFPIKSMQEQSAEVVQSLAKWKRIRLQEYQIKAGTGILTDMKALRPDEDLSPIHSIYVDQWDWEIAITSQDRNLDYLKSCVEKIYKAIKTVETTIFEEYPEKIPVLPAEVRFFHAEDLLQKYPHLSPKERENRIAREAGAVFITGIGGKLSNDEAHDDRAPDYDDWSTKTAEGYHGLNGDLVFWNPVLEQAFEISSMGIRVDAEALEKQLELTNCKDRKELEYHKQLLRGNLSLSMGGGIGQSRLCMFLLRKSHVGEVQVGIWPQNIRESCMKKGIDLL